MRTDRRGPGMYGLSRLWLVATLSLVVALAGAALGVQGRVTASRSQAQVGALRAQLARLEQRIGADETAAARDRRRIGDAVASAGAAQRAVARVSWELESVPSEAQLAALRSQLAAYSACLPQVQAEVEHLGINWRVDPVRPTSDYFRLSSAAGISPSCSPLLAAR